MARFRAYTSDSSDEENERSTQDQTHRSSSPADDDDLGTHDDQQLDGGEGSSSDEASPSETSDMDEDDALALQPRNAGKARNTHALVEDDDGEYRYAHELDGRESPGSSSTSSSPPPARARGDPTVIPWAQYIGVDAQKMHVMQTSLFRMPEEAAALKAMNQAPPARSRPPLRLTNQQANRKHSRDSDGDAIRFESKERASFAHDIEPPPYRPSRKYARVEGSHSAANEHEGAFVDAGLAFGRSFRASWGPGGKLVHLGGICGPFSSTSTTANSSTVLITTFPPSAPLSLCQSPISVTPNSASLSFANQGISLPATLLQHHLTYTPISPDDSRVPFASPSPRDLNFASFASLFPPASTSPPASLFRLGRALFDPIDSRLPPRTSNTSITPAIRTRVDNLLRTHALSQFFTDTLTPTIDALIRAPALTSSQSSNPNTSTNSRPSPAANASSMSVATAVFTLLTGNQVARACEKAADSGYLKLATLISQAGGDDDFQADLRSQLQIWKDEGLSGSGMQVSFGPSSRPLISDEVRKIYALLGGTFLEAEDGDSTLEVLQGLDWRRVFAACLWYGNSGTIGRSIRSILSDYEDLLSRDMNAGRVAKPVPWYIEPGVQKTSPWNVRAHTSSASPPDAHYALLRLHADPALSLAQALVPLSFSSSPVDWSMCWHLYIILSRCMRIRDLGDRGEPVLLKKALLPNGRNLSHDESSEDEETEKTEGHSPGADLLTSTYAFQLEGAGMIQEATFVLLHVEGSAGREKAIKDLLSRSASKLDEWMTRGLVGSLKIPMAWLNEAKAIYALDNGEIFNAYELYLAAGLHGAAHDLAVAELAPDAIIRKDFELLRLLFEQFTDRTIEGWHVRGKIFLDYAHVVTRLPELYEEQLQDAVPDAVHATEIEDLTRKIPKIIGILPDLLYNKADVRHKAALAEMTGTLVELMDKSKPLTVSQIPSMTLDSKIKLGHLRSTAYSRFLKSI